MMTNKITMRRMSRNSLFLDWNKLSESNSHASPFQQWQLHDTIARHYMFFFLAEQEWPCYFAFYKEGRLIMIAPMCKRYTKQGIRYVSFGATPTIAFQDFIYSDELDEDDMTTCLELMKAECGTMRFYNLSQESMLYKVLAKDLQPVRENMNITIPIGESYESYYASLSKNTRQNVRTAYNRMNTDGRQWTMELLDGKELTRTVEKELMDVYVARRKARYRTTSAIHEWFLRHEHFNTIAMRRQENARFIILRIDNVVAAFLAGYVDNNHQSLLIPRLAINNAFSRYSPGVVLVNESMKLLEDKLHLKYLDLSKGDEKYKFQMGGVNYYTFDFIY